MKKINKIRIILLIVMAIFVLINLTGNVFAAVNIDNIEDDNTSVDGSTELQTIGSIILSGITGVGIVLAVVVVAIIGVKYMMGSAEEKAEYKKSMMPYLVGALLVFGASAIARAVIGLVQ